jgi:hypothetical protein
MLGLLQALISPLSRSSRGLPWVPVDSVSWFCTIMISWLVFFFLSNAYCFVLGNPLNPFIINVISGRY